jgi:opacity protein-like surface antigen
VLVALTLVLPARSGAQGVQIGAGFGRTIPVGTYHADASGDGFNGGWQEGVLAAFPLPLLHGHLAGQLDLGYGSNAGNDQLTADLTTRVGAPTSEEAKLVGGMVSLVYAPRPAARLHPYVLGGAGLYHVTISVTSPTAGPASDNTGTELAWNLGVGLRYRLSGVALFLETRYSHVAGLPGFAGMTFVPLRLGFLFEGQ